MSQSSDTRTWYIVGVVAVVCIGLIAIVATKAVNSGSSTPAPAQALAPAQLIAQLTSVSQATLTTVGQGGVQKISAPLGAPALLNGSKPEVLYVGAEFCPYCAAERWPMVQALSRFGTFSNLGLTSSASSDAYPNTATLSFHGSSYTSQYLSFHGVETTSNEPQGSGYAPLDKLTADQQAIVDKYNAAPYLPASAAGSIPFIDFGGSYVISGSTFSPQVLQGKTQAQVGAALSNPADPITQGIIGSANIITATLCSLTKDQPAEVCTVGSIPALEKTVTSQPANTGK